MNHTSRVRRYFFAGTALLLVTAAGLTVRGAGLRASAQEATAVLPSPGSESMLEGFLHVEVASVSDAAEQILGRKTYMSHRMQSIFPTRFAGYAVTVLLKKDEGNKDP